MTQQIASTVPNRTPARSSSAGDREILQNYLDDIFDTPVLETDEQHELFRNMEVAEQQLRAELATIPAVAERLVARWHDRRAHGRVSGALSRWHRDGKPADVNAQIDRTLSQVEEVLDDLSDRADLDRATRERLLKRLAESVEAAEIALPVLLEIQDAVSYTHLTLPTMQ